MNSVNFSRALKEVYFPEYRPDVEMILKESALTERTTIQVFSYYDAETKKVRGFSLTLVFADDESGHSFGIVSSNFEKSTAYDSGLIAEF